MEDEDPDSSETEDLVWIPETYGLGWSMYVGRDGQPISQEEAFAAFRDPGSRRVASDEVNGHHVSTVWLIINHQLGEGPPIPFETMIFSQHEGECEVDHWQDRYPTEEEALRGHEFAKVIAQFVECGDGL